MDFLRTFGRILKKLIIIILSIGLIAGSATAIYLTKEYSDMMEDVRLPSLDELNPKEYTSKLYLEEDGSYVKDFQGAIVREHVELSNIPLKLQEAVIATEDKRFYEHGGVDIIASARALVANLKESAITQGGSTITQQLVKLNVLKDSSAKLERKLKEQFIAYNIEKDLKDEMSDKDAKHQILEAYLNSIMLGNGVYGVYSASDYFFNKNVADLNLTEISILASTIQNPHEYAPSYNYKNNKERRKLILQNMVDEEYITQKEADDSLLEDLSEIIANNINSRPPAPINTFYEDQIIEQVHADLKEKYELKDDEAYAQIYNGGLHIYSGMEKNVQNTVDEVYNDDSNFPFIEWEVAIDFEVKNAQNEKEYKFFRNFFASPDDSGDWVVEEENKLISLGYEILNKTITPTKQPQSAFIVINNETNLVAGVAGNRGSEKTVNRSFNRAVHALRQPGSVFKTLAAYAPALDTFVLDANSKILDAPYKTASGYSPKNWTGTHVGYISLIQALKDSVNVAAVRTLEDTGYDTAFSYLRKFGFTSLVDKKEVNGKIYSDKTPSLALGGLTDGVSLIELTAAYETIANQGIYNKPYFYTKVMDAQGNTILSNEKTNRVVISDNTASTLTQMLEAVVNNGTGTRAKMNANKIPSAGKTGTTSRTVDLLFVGFSPYYTSGIWIGHDLPKQMYGSNQHLSIWKKIMDIIHEGLEFKDFPKPKQIINNKANNLPAENKVPDFFKPIPETSEDLSEDLSEDFSEDIDNTEETPDETDIITTQSTTTANTVDENMAEDTN